MNETERKTIEDFLLWLLEDTDYIVCELDWNYDSGYYPLKISNKDLVDLYQKFQDRKFDLV